MGIFQIFQLFYIGLLVLQWVIDIGLYIIQQVMYLYHKNCKSDKGYFYYLTY